MFVDTNAMVRLVAVQPACEHRAELLAIWRALRRYQPQWTKKVEGRQRRQNPRFISEIQTLAKNDLTGFYLWATERGWAPGKVPVLERPRLLPDTALAWRYTEIWESGRAIFERVNQPLHRKAGSVPKELWVVDFDVCFLTVQTVARRRRNSVPLLNYTKERVQVYRRNSRRHQTRLEAFGEVKTLRGWVDDPRCVVVLSTLSKRLKAGMEPESALVTPVKSKRARLNLGGGRAEGEARKASEASYVKVQPRNLILKSDYLDRL